jgi:hypothetical protein
MRHGMCMDQLISATMTDCKRPERGCFMNFVILPLAVVVIVVVVIVPGYYSRLLFQVFIPGLYSRLLILFLLFLSFAFRRR